MRLAQHPRGRYRAVGVNAVPKTKALRDRAWLDHLRTEACVITGQKGTADESVVPTHIGTAGKSLKSPDDEALPIKQGIHQQMHSRGEISVLRAMAPDWLLRAAFRAYARELYRAWKGQG